MVSEGLIQFYTDLMEKDFFKIVFRGFYRIVEGLQRALALIDGLQKVREFSGRFVEGL